jgi:hypothetical protein
MYAYIKDKNRPCNYERILITQLLAFLKENLI